ncbi:hypothetical protein BH24ACI5_BH24ACI5_19380 [soil metagenome]
MIVVVPALFLFTKKRADVRADKYRGSRIRCPACQWEPTRADRWYCSPGCGYAWNTFDTRALCPGCAKQWTYTVCLHCAVASPHDAWYEDEPDRP